MEEVSEKESRLAEMAMEMIAKKSAWGTLSSSIRTIYAYFYDASGTKVKSHNALLPFVVSVYVPTTKEVITNFFEEHSEAIKCYSNDYPPEAKVILIDLMKSDGSEFLDVVYKEIAIGYIKDGIINISDVLDASVSIEPGDKIRIDEEECVYLLKPASKQKDSSLSKMKEYLEEFQEHERQLKKEIKKTKLEAKEIPYYQVFNEAMKRKHRK